MAEAERAKAGPWIAGSARDATAWTELRDPYRGELVAEIANSDASTVDLAVEAAAEAHQRVAAMPAHERAAILRRAADLADDRRPEYAKTISRQTGKSLKNATREVERASWTLRASAAAAESLAGMLHPNDVAPGGEGLLTLTIRRPIGIIGAITPFNAPFNLVVHKVAPAFAAGNSIVIKPSSQAPLTALDVAQLVEDAGAPAGAVNVVPGDRSTVAAMTANQDIGMYTFTGGRAAGEAIRVAAGPRRVTLEMGGNSPNIVHSDASLAGAAEACVSGGFGNTGQSCNSVQRIIVQRTVVDEFTELLVGGVKRLTLGDPLDPMTDVGTLVDLDAAERIERWLDEARQSGAQVLTGGERSGAQIEPAVVADAPIDSRIVCQELFGPVVVLIPYDDLDEAIQLANNTDFGLQSAVFTSSLDVALRVANELKSGTVLVNRSSNFRLDHLPYGGVKHSGLGREGPAEAVLDMTETRLLVIAPSGRE